ncbi:MAG: diaminopimelate epimerase [Betaproteobacteria bacterium]|jgi:diaminopimelate epimerase|nr:diaminopimelate epimerase [Betaproteobacteria bacterium]MDO7704983.1 diaminopimelate epimerase [Burkholderiaceae bacterium]
MQIQFTKMQGAGNDFVVLDETQGVLGLSAAQYRFLADRHFGIGADQILSVRQPASDDVDFSYVIHNADGGEVEHCGNGARCFVRYVRSHGLTDKTTVRVQVANGTIELTEDADQQVRVNMGAPEFDVARVPFNATDLPPEPVGNWTAYTLDATAASDSPQIATRIGDGNWPAEMSVGVVSMGNPHAVQVVGDVAHAPVHEWGPWVESHERFPNRVNAGFMQVVGRDRIKLRVFERGAGETLACGTGACAAVVAGIRWGLLDASVHVETRGGVLHIVWDGLGHPVWMSGPATTVFEGRIEIPERE